MIETQQVGNFRLAPPCSSSKTGLPSAIQGAVFCLANIFVQASVNGFGETVMAAYTVVDRVEQIVKLVSGDQFGQIFITDTNRKYLDAILQSINHGYALFRVEQGEVQPMEEACLLYTSDAADD